MAVKSLAINALSALRGGGQTYIINFLKHLPEEGDFKVLLIVNKRNYKVFERFKSNQVYIYESEFASQSIFHRTYWEIFKLSSYLVSNNVSYYYAPGGIMVTKFPKEIKTVTALRNMLPFDERERSRFALFSYIRFKLWLLRYVFLLSYRRADKVIFISKYSKSIVNTYLSDIDDKSIVVPHGLNEQFLNKDFKLEFELPKNIEKNGFYLYVSILDVYKAQKEVIKTWRKLKEVGFKYPLVLAGSNYNEYGAEVLKLINELDLENNVIYLGNIEYNNLPLLYKSSRGLIFASSCECCPNILLEKLGASKPVLCSNIEPMPEFGEDSVLYFDPYCEDSLLKQVELLESNESLREELSRKSGIQAQKFNWSKTINKTLEFIFK